MKNEAGKGDTYRKVDYKKWSENYERIFRKYEVYDRFPDSNLPIIQFVGSLDECKDWLSKNQVRLGSMCVQYAIRKSDGHCKV